MRSETVMLTLSNSNSFGAGSGSGAATPSWFFPVLVWNVRPGQRWRPAPG
jgi:hypothetical protein